MEYIINGEWLSAREYIEFLKETDSGVAQMHVGKGIGKALIKRLHELAGGEENIIMFTCANKNAVGFYEKIGMTIPNDIMGYDKMPFTAKKVVFVELSAF